MKININPMARRLMYVRGLRSFGQGILVVDLALYLKEMEWSATSIGSVLSIGGIFGALLILVVGILSDRYGRKMFLILYEALTIISALIAFFYSSKVLLSLAIIVAGFGRGQAGGAGPFSPAEHAWLAQYVKRIDRGKIYSFNNAIGFLGMGIGAILAGTPHLWENSLPGSLAYRPLFAVIAILSFISLLIIATIKEKPIVRQEIENIKKSPDEKVIRQRENKEIIKLSLINIINGLAIGLTGPLISYWFSVRFQADAASIGLTLAIAFFLTTLASIFNGYMASNLGMVKSVTLVRYIAAGLMLLLPFSPNFTIASIIFIIRNALNRGTQGARSALSASLTRDHRRGLSTSVNAFSMRATSSIGPTISGYLLDLGLYAMPFYFTAGLQLFYAWIYQKMFRHYDTAEGD